MCHFCCENETTRKYLTLEECETLTHNELCILVWQRRDNITHEEAKRRFEAEAMFSSYRIGMLKIMLGQQLYTGVFWVARFVQLVVNLGLPDHHLSIAAARR